MLNPLCTRKDKRDEDTGEIIHFFRFPDDENTRKLWLHAIRRDVGPYFSITHGTRVCSRHFKSEDLRKTPNKTFLRPGAVPSIFAWKRSSPRKRPPPTYRSEPHLFPKKSKKDKDNVPKTDNTDLQRKKIETAPSTSTSHDPKTEKLSVKSQETTEVAAPTESESGSEMSEIVNKDSFIRELQDRLDGALSDKEKLEETVSQLMEKSTKLEGRLFCFENISNNDSLITFYTGFPNLKTLMALYEFLRPGANGENIRYSSSARDDIQEGHGEHSAKQGRPRSLKTIDEFFLTLCRLRQGSAEIHLAQLFVIPSGPLQIALNVIVFVICLVRKEPAMYVLRYLSMVAFTPKSLKSVCLSQFSSLQSTVLGYRMVRTCILLPDISFFALSFSFMIRFVYKQETLS